MFLVKWRQHGSATTSASHLPATPICMPVLLQQPLAFTSLWYLGLFAGENLRDGAEKKVVFITGRVHPGETPSSFVCQGIIDFLVSQHPIARVLREHLVFKIAPMLNPDGVYLGNYSITDKYLVQCLTQGRNPSAASLRAACIDPWLWKLRCSLMGFDLNRHWLDPSPWVHPTLHGVKQLIIKMYNDPKTSLEFYIDIHAHSTMMNGFMYGNIFEDEERFQRQSIFPKLLCQNAEDFSYTSTSFNRDAVKAGTGRRFLGGLLDHTSYCYTLEVSFYSYIIGGTTAAVPYTEEAFRLGAVLLQRLPGTSSPGVLRLCVSPVSSAPLVLGQCCESSPQDKWGSRWFIRKENPPPYKHLSLRGSASNVPSSKGDKKSSLNHKDPSTPF
ncbi:Cytosolic carboxypeptidase 6 [Microtus ochrogaster]|uniref:Cytosolic carboxypeptidase 6 n=1 Tax=Microtus ochrogaster TaxID=79684 RepID=A0A8J6GF48_MICOH|nr:Cytosolic carboxypeptidase 6 [Microtus ochrogaster]